MIVTPEQQKLLEQGMGNKMVGETLVELLESASTSSGGSGDVVGPSSSTDSSIALWDGATGKLLKNSSINVTSNVIKTPSGTNLNLQTSANTDAILIGFPAEALLAVTPFSGSNGVNLGPNTNQSIRLKGFTQTVSGTGGTVFIRGGDSTTGSTTGGGQATINGGSSNTTTGSTITGSVNITGGSNVGTGKVGYAIISGGPNNNSAGAAGDLWLVGGRNSGGGSSVGGDIVMYSGSTTAGSGLPRLTVKPLGDVYIGGAALATNATAGFFSITSSAGVPSGTPTLGYSGSIPLHYDSTNNTLYAYNVSWQAVNLNSSIAELSLGTLGPTPAIDFSNAPAQKGILSSDATMTLSGGRSGASYVLRIVQDSTPRTLSITGVKWPGGIPPVISTGSGAIDLINLYFDGTTYYGSFAQDHA